MARFNPPGFGGYQPGTQGPDRRAFFDLLGKGFTYYKSETPAPPHKTGATWFKSDTQESFVWDGDQWVAFGGASSTSPVYAVTTGGGTAVANVWAEYGHGIAIEAGGWSIDGSSRLVFPEDGIYAASVRTAGEMAPHRFVVSPAVNGSGYPVTTYWTSDTNVEGRATFGPRLYVASAGDTMQMWIHNRTATQAMEFEMHIFKLGGPRGATGATGPQGPPGPPGEGGGVPDGGAIGQALRKWGDGDGEADWADDPTHVLEGDPENPPPEMEEGQLLWDGESMTLPAKPGRMTYGDTETFDATTTPTEIQVAWPAGVDRSNVISLQPLSSINNRLYIDSWGFGDWDGNLNIFATVRSAHNVQPRGGSLRCWYWEPGD